MDFGSLLVMLCLETGIGWCDERQAISLPDPGALAYKPRPKEKPKAAPVEKPLSIDFPVLVIKETVHQAPSAPVTVFDAPEPPKTDPQMVAYHRLLALRRKGAIEGGFAVKGFGVMNAIAKTAETDSEAFPASLSVPNEPSLDFNFHRDSVRATRYEYPSEISRYPINNERIVRADRYINAIFETGVNSDFASADGGEAILVVESHVYGYHGRNILIPKGSRLICEFGSADHANSTRLSFTCKRILMGDSGVEIYQIASRVGDSQGYGGVSGDVDNRFWEKYGMAFLLTGISTAVKVAIGTIDSANNANLATSLNAGAEEISQKFGEITATVLADKINLKPIIRIAQGTPVTIRPSKDWYIPKPDRSLNNDFKKKVAQSG